MFRRYGAGCGRPHVGKIAFVLQQRQRLAGARAEHQHRAVAGGQSELRVLVKAGGHLDGEGLVAANVAVLDVAIARRVDEFEMAHRRHHHLAARVCHETIFHGADDRRGGEPAHQLGAAEDPQGFSRGGPVAGGGLVRLGPALRIS